MADHDGNGNGNGDPLEVIPGPERDPKFDVATADDPKAAPAGFMPSASAINRALAGAHAREREAYDTGYGFVPASPMTRGAPGHWTTDRQGAGTRVDYGDDLDDDTRKLRDDVLEFLPRVALIISWSRMFHDRGRRADLDAQLDAIGIPPVEYDGPQRRFVTVPPERQAVYDALAGVYNAGGDGNDNGRR